MKKKRIPLKSAAEYDAFTKWRRFYSWKPGRLKKVKRQYNKRFRKILKKINYKDYYE